LLTLAQVRAGNAMLLKNLHEHLLQGTQALVCDAETNDDLQRIAKASIGLSELLFWVGSAGLANQMPNAARLIGHAEPASRIEVKGAILTVVGSVSAVSRAQAEALFNTRAMKRVDLPADVLTDGERHADWSRYQRQLGATLESGGDLLLMIANAGQPDLRQGLMLCQALARLVSPFSVSLGGMVSMGGETTHALLSAFRCIGLDMVREVQPGVPLSVTLGARTFPIITKAGAFGTADTLVSCYDALRGMRHESTQHATTQNNNVRALQR
jgi:uncharacterized protein YgbK (DUF1537 family)